MAVLPGIFFFISIFKDNVQPQWLLISFVAMIMLMYWKVSGFKFRVSNSQNDESEFKTNNAKLKTQNPKLTTQNIFFALGLIGILLILILRILIAVPSLSPFTKNHFFAENAGKFKPENPVFEKYQEASVYNFFHPNEKARVHRTLGNRKSQFDLWNWEEELNGKTITFISPWTKSDHSFKGFKNRAYYLKEIPDFETYHLIEVKTLTNLDASPNEKINLGLKIINHHQREIEIGGNSNLQFTVNYYQDFQYNILYSPKVEMGKIILAPGEELDIAIDFENISQTGNYKFAIGVNNSQIGTTYVSNVVGLKVN